jgi:hypothetical protein
MAHFDLQIVLPEMKQLANDVALAPFVEDALDNIRASEIGSKSNKSWAISLAPLVSASTPRRRFPHNIHHGYQVHLSSVLTFKSQAVNSW